MIAVYIFAIVTTLAAIWFIVVREIVNTQAVNEQSSRDRWVAWFVSGSVTVQGVTDLRRRQLDQICDEQAAT